MSGASPGSTADTRASGTMGCRKIERLTIGATSLPLTWIVAFCIGLTVLFIQRLVGFQKRARSRTCRHCPPRLHQHPWRVLKCTTVQAHHRCRLGINGGQQAPNVEHPCHSFPCGFHAPEMVITFPALTILLATTAAASSENPFGAPSESVRMSMLSWYPRRRPSMIARIRV